MTCLDNVTLAVMLGANAQNTSVQLGWPPGTSDFLLEKSRF